MKKHFVALCFILLSVCIFAQQKQVPAIKIYLEDAETLKNINDAKVTLEGFDLPIIFAKYNKEDKSYYFNEIPAGYNTVMAYHEKYNEKGFQNVLGLPNELKFKLFNPIKVSYGFEFFWFPYFPQKSYVEDPYKISISTDVEMNYNAFREYIAVKIKELNLEIELVNPLWEDSKIQKNSFTFPNQKEAYPLINLKKNKLTDSEYVFPLKSGVSNIFPDRIYSNTTSDICFIARKKDGSKFKRFNDPIIKKLKDENFNIAAIVINKIGAGDGVHTKMKTRDRLNKKFYMQHKIDSSKVFFYDLSVYKTTPKLFFWKHRAPLGLIDLDQFPQLPYFFLISNNKLDIPEQRSNFKEQQFQSIPVQDKAIGLGIVDQYEYYLNVN
ncbi:hypothetical protein OD917_08975 [Flavobacterium sp. SH_e]|uniref:hypothetical protein n=1 Tax=Flavobacterium TaxID=237 RepID=UPI0021E46917|nr:hypothetical protein [Flavobacterium sp. SH_e]MCV2485053.1 hypothetical protein [Flavobacterium sp. SH_e]